MKSEFSAPAPRKAVAECVSGVLISDGAVLVEKRRADDDAFCNLGEKNEALARKGFYPTYFALPDWAAWDSLSVPFLRASSISFA